MPGRRRRRGLFGRGFLLLLVVVSAINLTVGKLPDTPKPTGKFVDVNGRRMHFIEGGTATRGSKPVVLIHGLPGTALDFEKVLPRLKGLHTVTIDRAGFGFSEGGAKTLDQQVDSVHALIGRLGLKDAVIVGHSYGGTMAAALAERYPDDVGGVVLVAAAIGGTRIPLAERLQGRFVQVTNLPVIRQLFDWTVGNLMKRGMTELGVIDAFTPRPVDDTYKQRVLAITVKHDNLVSLSQNQRNFYDQMKVVDKKLKTIRKPTVILAGLGDQLVSIDGPRKQAELIQDAKLIELNSGHMITYSYPGQVAAQATKLARR